MIISFGWTTAALLAGRKTVTRRNWAHEYAARFRAGQIHDAWNTTPRNVRANPHRLARIRLTDDVYLEHTCDAPDSDWDAEGFAYMEEIGGLVNKVTPREYWQAWKLDRELQLYVVRFELVELLV